MRTLRLLLLHAVTTLVLMTTLLGTAPLDAQFGGLGADSQEGPRTNCGRRKRPRSRRRRSLKPRRRQQPRTRNRHQRPLPAAPAQPAATSGFVYGSSRRDAAPAFQAFSKFDFVPGEKVVALDDFTQDAVGDYPAKWNTNASGEIVTVAGKPGRWLKLAGTGFYLPEFVNALPDDFTLEFDVLTPPTFSGYPLNAVITDLPSGEAAAWSAAPNSVILRLNPGAGDAGTSETQVRQNGDSAAQSTKSVTQFTKTANPVHVSMWRQRQRIRVYLNEEKVWDLPRAFLATAKLNMLVFGLRVDDPTGEYYVGNLRLAVGAPDTRNKIITQGKWVSHGILFDVNSDRIKGESYGSLKEIAGVLTESRRRARRHCRSHRLGRRDRRQPRPFEAKGRRRESGARQRVQESTRHAWTQTARAKASR